MTTKTKFAFTDDALLALKPRAARFEVYDNLQPGLELRVTPTGTKSFRYRKSGQTPVTLGTYIKGTDAKRTRDQELDAIEMTIEQARRQARITVGDHAKGIDVAGVKREERELNGLRGETMETILGLYVERQTFVEGQPLREKTKADYRDQFDLFFGERMQRPYKELTPKIILDLHIARSEKRMAVGKDGREREIGSRAGADRVLHVLAAMADLLKLGPSLSDLAYEERGVTPTKVRAGRVDPEDDLPSRAAWLQKYVKREKDSYKGLVAQQYLVALSTGMRLGTINRLTWEMLKPVPKMDGRFYLDTPATIQKNKRPYINPLAPRAASVILARRDRLIAAGIKPSGLMFPRVRSGKPARDCKTIAADIVFDLGADGDFTMHDLRKAMNTLLESDVRAPEFIRRKLMNRVAKDTEEEHYLNATLGRKLSTLMTFADEAEEWAYNGVPSDRRLAEFRRAARDASRILRNKAA